MTVNLGDKHIDVFYFLLWFMMAVAKSISPPPSMGNKRILLHCNEIDKSNSLYDLSFPTITMK